VSLSDFVLRPNDEVVTESRGTDFLFTPLGGCVDTRWYPERDPITLTIVSGSEFGKFAIGDGPAIHTTVTLLVSELPTVRFIPSGRLGTYPVRIEARCLSLVNYWEIEVRYCSILLGETKYFYAVEGGGGETRPWMKIYEATSPELPSGAQTDGVWTVVRRSGVEPNRGKRLGAYWEQEKPIPNGTGTLPLGMMRVVGRYWHPDSIYMVDVIATKRVWWKGSQGTIGYRVPIEVKKPDVLGDPDLTDQARHSVVKDVTNSDLDLDALLIKYAGENGIPPQIIKGQIEKETSLKSAWRYEPFKDLEWQRESYRKYFASDLPFNVREGVPNDLPPSYTNVSPTPYVRSLVKIGDFAVQHWFDRYVQRGTGAEPDVILGSKELTRIWFWVFLNTSLAMGQSGIPVGIPEMKRYTHDFVKGRILDGTFEGFGRIAQTRKVTSYGYVQMLYITAVDFSWRETEGRYGTIGRAYVDKRDVTQYPEKLNEQDFLFPRYSDFTLFDLRLAITEATRGKKIKANDKYSTSLVETIPEGNWPTGFDQVWTRAMQWHNLGEAGYGQDVMLKANNYLPAYKE